MTHIIQNSFHGEKVIFRFLSIFVAIVQEHAILRRLTPNPKPQTDKFQEYQVQVVTEGIMFVQ